MPKTPELTQPLHNAKESAVKFEPVTLETPSIVTAAIRPGTGKTNELFTLDVISSVVGSVSDRDVNAGANTTDRLCRPTINNCACQTRSYCSRP